MKRLLLSPIWSVMVLAAAVALQYFNPALIESVKLRYFDQLIVNQPKVENNIYTVNIDEATLEQQGQWPWPRGEYAQLIQQLFERGAGLVIFNVLMPDQDRGGEDDLLIQALENYPVITTVVGADQSRNQAVNPGAAIINAQYSDLIVVYPGIIANAPGIDLAAIGTGIANTLPEIDGVTRRVPLVISSDGVLYPSITVEVLRVIAGDPNFQIRLSPLGVDRLRIPQFGELPTDQLGRVWIDWSQTARSASASDLPDDFGGAVVFVSATAAGLNTPIATAAGGVWPHELQAALLGTVFNQSNIQRPAWAQGAETVALLIAGLMLIAAARWTWAGIAVFVITVGGTVGTSIWLFAAHQYLTDGITIAAALLAVGVVRYVIKFADEFLQKQAIKRQFAGYASPEVVEILQTNPELVKQGVKKDISIVMTDLRGFTPLGESYGDDVKGLTEIMNSYMDAISQPVLRGRAMIIKYIGDATMHIHGAPVDDDKHAHAAVQTALNMIEAVDEFNQHLDQIGKPRVGMGAGVNTGVAYIGEIGSKARHSYDVLGDSVSTAARLEGQSKGYGVLLIVGSETYQRTKDEFCYLELDEIAVKGKTQGQKIYTVIKNPGGVIDYANIKKLHDRMLAEYRNQQFDRAIELCEALTTHFQGQMAGYYKIWIERCEYMKTVDLPNDWDGIYRATSK